MLRVYKYINFAFAEKSTAAQSVGFASQPGTIPHRYHHLVSGVVLVEGLGVFFSVSVGGCV